VLAANGAFTDENQALVVVKDLGDDDGWQEEFGGDGWE
jgi:hypothetical protein